MRIRRAMPGDRKGIEEIARLTWEGEDYLGRVFDSWLEDGHFYVLEMNGKIAGTVKLTLLPGKVGWLEGLRVHPEFRNRGLGRRLQDFIVGKGRELAMKGYIDSLEFATYYLNGASIEMARKDGFKVVKRYYLLGMETNENYAGEIARGNISSLEELGYGEYIPLGWKFIRRVPGSVEYLRRKSHIYECGGAKFLVPVDSESSFVPFRISRDYVEKILPCMHRLAGERGEKYVEIMLPEELENELNWMEELGFRCWEEKRVKHVLLFRMSPL